MDLKEPGNVLYLVGATRDELGGSHYHLVHGLTAAARCRASDLAAGPEGLRGAARRRSPAGWCGRCHDLSEGGLAVAVAEMAFAGGVGADVDRAERTAGAEGCPTRCGCSANRRRASSSRCDRGTPRRSRRAFAGLPLTRLGQTVKEPRLRIAGAGGEWLVWAELADLKEAWQKPLRW